MARQFQLVLLEEAFAPVMPSVIELPWVHAAMMVLWRQVWKAVVLLLLAIIGTVLVVPLPLSDSTFSVPLIYLVIAFLAIFFSGDSVAFGAEVPVPAPAPVPPPAGPFRPMLTINLHVPPGVQANQVPCQIYQRPLLPPAPPAPVPAVPAPPPPAVPGIPCQSISSTWRCTQCRTGICDIPYHV
jgi:hypothetical protein